MAGIDRAARLQSYSALFPNASGSEAEDPITIDRPDGTSETYYLDLYRFSDIFSQGRSNGVDVHLFSFGIPAGNMSDFAFDDLPNPDSPNLGDFPEGSQLDALRQWFDDSLQNVLTDIFEAACPPSCTPTAFSCSTRAASCKRARTPSSYSRMACTVT
jgi:hypothetical protein